jgi:serine/threonine protein kinase
MSVTKIGAYPVLEKVGRGGQGQVYKGLDPATGQILAIKVLPREATADPVLGLRFAQECQVTRKLDHPHIVRVFDFGLDGSRPYLVMEYIEGESLGERLRREGSLPEAEAVRVIAQVGEALHWAHQRRLIHRDVKPDNILLGVDGQAKLADLGLCKNLEGDFNLTQTLSCLGTPNFMAPEQFEDAKRADALSDLYSLAATLYMAVTGELPFRARSARAVATVYRKKLVNDISAPRLLVPTLSQRLNDAILRGLRANPNERPASVLEFVQSLVDEQAGVSTALAVSMPLPSADVREGFSSPENRRHARFPSQRVTSCRALQRIPDDPWVGQVNNISRTGLCLDLNRRFEPGALLRIVLDPESHRRCSLVVRVVWIKQQSPKTWTVGCHLDQPLSEHEVHELR